MKSCFGPDLEDHDSLREDWRVYIYIQHDLDNYLCVASDQSFDRKEMVQIMREHYSQKYARLKLQIKAYMVEPLLAAEPGDKAIIAKPNGLPNRIYTKINPINLYARQTAWIISWRVTWQAIMTSFAAALTDAQVGMRVKFGTFILSRWKPLGDSAGYDLHKFPQMLRDER